MNRAKKIARQHANGRDALESKTAVAVDEMIHVTGPIAPAERAPVGFVCDLAEGCDQVVTHEVPVRVDGRDARVYGCLAHLTGWVAADPNAAGSDDGAER